MTIILSNLQRLTSVVPSSLDAARYMQLLFKAETIADSASLLKTDEEISVEHVGLGDAEVEFVSPKTASGIWRERLSKHGAALLSLTFNVPDLEAATKLLEEENVHPIEQQPSRCVFDTMEIVGFNIELSQGQARPAPLSLWGRASPLLHVEITHHDEQAASKWLKRVFGAQSVETEFSDFLVKTTGGRMKHIHHVQLGDTVLQYIDPTSEAGPWYDQLQERGSSVHNLTWLVDNMEEIAAASERAGTRDLRYFEFDYSKLFGEDTRLKPKVIGRIIDPAALLGFHTELSEPQASNINAFLLKQVPQHMLKVVEGTDI